MFALVFWIIVILQSVQAEPRCTKQESQGVCIPEEFKHFRRGVELQSYKSKEINVYTPYLCLDQCYRQINCNGITFFMNFSLNVDRKQRCKLFYATVTERTVSCDQQQLCPLSTTKNWISGRGSDQ